MSKDLFDVARPLRDAALVEINRIVQGEPEADANVIAANTLGVHLGSILMAFVSERYQTVDGHVKNDNLQGILASAIAVAVCNSAMSFRPVIDGQVMPGTINAHLLLQGIAQETFRQVACAENGLQDFNVQFRRNEDGALENTPFDFNSMMKGAGT